MGSIFFVTDVKRNEAKFKSAVEAGLVQEQKIGERGWIWVKSE
jgi:hypothetical protein